jgi:hypothetical protein
MFDRMSQGNYLKVMFREAPRHGGLSFTYSYTTMSSRWILAREAAAWLRRAHGATASHSHGEVKQLHGEEADAGGARLGMASIAVRSRRVDVPR